MPKRDDIRKILIIGSGPIVIGQACEFDYSGTQACKALREEGYEVVLVNSNPATIMTDPEMAHWTYIEPITKEVVARVIEKERPDALLPTLGGQTGLNVAVQLAESGVLDAFGVRMIGANLEAIRKAENRELFRESMARIGLDLPKSGHAVSLEEAEEVAAQIGFPVIIRPAFTLGGIGGGVANDPKELEEKVRKGLDASMIHQVLIEESVIGWKEFELEVMRDLKDNVVIICSIENFDPMGIHTGDSITVAPAQTLTDKEYQLMRDAAIACIREIGVETGGSNIQFAVDPHTGRMVIIEMNPRVSRSSALASKATGFPIAKIAAKLAVGYTLDEIANDITKETPASFEPTIDYCVVKIPRFTFEKFPGADPALTTSMKSVGETMAIGRTFKEALQKGLRSLEIGRYGLGNDGRDWMIWAQRESPPEEHEGPVQLTLLDNGKPRPPSDPKRRLEIIRERLLIPNALRIFFIREALREGMGVDEIHQLTNIDPWFLHHIREIVELEGEIEAACPLPRASSGAPSRMTLEGLLRCITEDLLRRAKEYGFSDVQLAHMWSTDEETIRQLRISLGVVPSYKLVDTCAAEFEAYTPYYYSTYDRVDESRPGRREKVLILGGGPNRIGQGIEFDYCCCHASFALKELGYESIMVNSNPETVSTDYDTSDRLYFEPLTREDVLAILDREKAMGVIVQFGGQTPLNLAVPLQEAGVRLLGTSSDSIDRAEDRERFQALLRKLNLVQPENGTATSVGEARRVAADIGYPVVVRPSFVLGGRAMEIVFNERDLESFVSLAVAASPDRPILIDKYLEDAIEVDVDAVSDGRDVIIAGIMEHVEEAGIHSGDSACVLPPITLSRDVLESIRQNTYALARELEVVGLMNVQYAVKNDIIYVLEVNPRASRTIPFVSKATGVPWAKVATKVMLGKSLRELGITREIVPAHLSVKESVFPFKRFPGVDAVLGPEMKSTGEVMGIDFSFGMAFAKSQLAADMRLPLEGTAFVSVKNQDKRAILYIVKRLVDLGFDIVATEGTANALIRNDIEVTKIRKVSEGRPNVVDLIKRGRIQLIINTPAPGRTPRHDEVAIRTTAVAYDIPLVTTVSGAAATVNAIETLKKRVMDVKSLQEYHREVSLETVRAASSSNPTKSP
jgi:carbamoyl-phosphate synthase large subunit